MSAKCRQFLKRRVPRGVEQFISDGNSQALGGGPTNRDSDTKTTVLESLGAPVYLNVYPKRPPAR